MSKELSSDIHCVSFTYPMSQAEYRKIEKHSDNQTLLVTIPYEFAQAIPIARGDVVKMQLEGKRVTMEKV